MAPKTPLQCKRCQHFGHTKRNCAWRVVRHTFWGVITPKQQLKCCSCKGNHTANCQRCSKWKEAKAGANRTQVGRKTRAGTSAEQESLGTAGTTSSEGVVSPVAQTTTRSFVETANQAQVTESNEIGTQNHSSSQTGPVTKKQKRRRLASRCLKNPVSTTTQPVTCRDL